MKLADLLVGTKAELFRTTARGVEQGVKTAADFGQEISEFTIDSRSVIPGAYFFALKGEHTDGHAFAAEALVRGAAGVVVGKTYLGEMDAGRLPANRNVVVTPEPLQALQNLAAHWRLKHDVTVIGITGSLGKTTIKEAVAQALKPLGYGRVLKSEANLNTEIGIPLELLRLTDEHRVAVLEMGMYRRGDIALLARLSRPQVGIVANVQSNHLERLGTIKRIAQTKAELVHALPGDGLAVLNGDDESVRAMSAATTARSIFYGYDDRRDFWASAIRGHGRQGFETVIRHGTHQIRVDCRMPGKHNAINLLPAAAVAHHLGVSWDEIQCVLSDFCVTSRSAFIAGPNGSTILDDRYNASAPSVLAALTLLREEPGRRLALLGEMYELGSEEELQHRLVGQASADLDLLLLLGPRTHWIKEEAIKGGLPAKSVITVQGNEQAIEVARKYLGPGDTMLIKGSRGLQLESVVTALAGRVDG